MKAATWIHALAAVVAALMLTTGCQRSSTSQTAASNSSTSASDAPAMSDVSAAKRSETPELEPVNFVDTNGTSAELDGNGVKRFSFDNFALSDEFAQIKGLLTITAAHRPFNCKTDAGRTSFGVSVSKCETEVDKRTGEHFKFTFNAGRLALLEWWAPVGNYDYVRKSLVKRYGSPAQNCNGGSWHDKSYREDNWCTSQRFEHKVPYRSVTLENTANGQGDTTPMVHVTLRDMLLGMAAIEEAKQKQQASLEQ
jgi:hypothetical protein